MYKLYIFTLRVKRAGGQTTGLALAQLVAGILCKTACPEWMPQLSLCFRVQKESELHLSPKEIIFKRRKRSVSGVRRDVLTPCSLSCHLCGLCLPEFPALSAAWWSFRCKAGEHSHTSGTVSINKAKKRSPVFFILVNECGTAERGRAPR